jgi:CRP-like cAMP-binding protein
MLAGVAVLIAAEVVSILGGLGPVFGVIALGYAMVLGVIYWLYRWAKATDGTVRLGGAEMRVAKPYVLDNRPMNVSLFEGMTTQQADEVMTLGQRFVVPTGMALVQEGEPGNTLYIVLSGQAQLTARSGVGEITVRISGPGDAFPLAAMVGTGIHITSAEAMTDMEVLALPTGALRALFERRPEIGMRMYAAAAGLMANRYRRTLAHLTDNTAKALQEMDFFANV